MKIFNCVKTKDTAIKILAEEGFKRHYVISHCQCECGETQAVTAYTGDFTEAALIGICESCGDDDAFVDEVINS